MKLERYGGKQDKIIREGEKRRRWEYRSCRERKVKAQ